MFNSPFNKTIYQTLFLLLSFTFYEAQIAVKIKVKHERPACGGIRYDESDAESWRFALPGKTLYIRTGEVNDLSQKAIRIVVTDSKGIVKFKLPKGTYCVVLEQKADSSEYLRLKNAYKLATPIYSSIDTVCLKKWLYTPDLIIHVSKKGDQNYELITYGNCDNLPHCVDYIGPTKNKKSSMMSR